MVPPYYVFVIRIGSHLAICQRVTPAAVDASSSGVMASRLLLLPGGLRTEHVARIHSQPFWTERLRPLRNGPWYICICEQGRKGRHWEAAALKTALEDLLQPDPDCPPIIQIVDLGWENIEEHLDRCDVFYMCGGEPKVFADLFGRYKSTMGKLGSIIRSGRIVYIGSCGGACIMSSYYAGVRTMQVIPGMISVYPNEGSIGMHAGEVPRVTLTNQTGLLLLGEEPQAFVITSKGVCKHHHLVDMVESQVRTCFQASKVVDVPPPPVPPPPPPQLQSPVPTEQSPPVQASPVPSQEPATAAPPCTNSSAYSVQHCLVDGNVIKMYFPRDRRPDQTRHVVLYLASTKGEEAPIENFTGKEIVYAPQFTNHGRKPWKNDVPDWLLNWVAAAQRNDAKCTWSLFCFSRGAAWGAILAADVRLNFHRVLLAAPYVLPSYNHDPGHRMRLTERLPLYGHNLCIAFGTEDPWKPCSLIEDVQRTCIHQVFQGLGHEATLAKCVQEFWNELLF